MKIEEVLNTLKTSPEGLSQEEAERRLKEYGFNELKERKKVTPWKIFFGQFKDIFILLLIAAAIFSAVIGYYESITEKAQEFMEAYADTITIGAIVFLVALTGFIQEYRAEKAFRSPKKISSAEGTCSPRRKRSNNTF